MKPQNAFWTAILLLATLGIGGCTLELTQQEEATEQTSQAPQEQEAGK